MATVLPSAFNSETSSFFLLRRHSPKKRYRFGQLDERLLLQLVGKIDIVLGISNPARLAMAATVIGLSPSRSLQVHSFCRQVGQCAFAFFPESHQQEQELPAGQPTDQRADWRRYNEDQESRRGLLNQPIALLEFAAAVGWRSSFSGAPR